MTTYTQTSLGPTGSIGAFEWHVPDDAHIDSALITPWAKCPRTQFTSPVNDFLGAP